VEASLKEKLAGDLKQAMKSGNITRRNVIRLVMSAIKNAEIAKHGELAEPDVIGVLVKEARQRQESIDAFKQGNRQDLVAQEEAELAIIGEYLPQQASREEIVAAAQQIIADVGAEGPRDKGKVMPRLIAQFKGKADGREINEIVTELLSS
jgi:uncharacterized protein YqeY